MSEVVATPRRRAVAAAPPAPVDVSAPGNLLSAIVGMARDPSMDADKLERFLAMQERMEARQAAAAFNAAFVRLQAALPRVKKNGSLSYPKNKNDPDGPKVKIANFARCEDIDAAIRPLLEAEGFALSFRTQPRPGDGGGLIVTCVLMHTEGHSTETSIPVPLDTSGGKNNIQGYGSALSYGKRYTTCAALNIITEDEDDDAKQAAHYDEAAEITEAQALEIEALLLKTKVSRPDFMAHYQVDSLLKLTAAQHAEALRRLRARQEKMEAPNG